MSNETKPKPLELLWSQKMIETLIFGLFDIFERRGMTSYSEV